MLEFITWEVASDHGPMGFISVEKVFDSLWKLSTKKRSFWLKKDNSKEKEKLYFLKNTLSKATNECHE